MYEAAFTLVGVKVLFINEYHLKEADYQADWYPADWDEPIKVATKMTKRKPNGTLERSGLFVRIGGQVRGVFDRFEPILRTAGARFLWREGGKLKTDINSEAGLRAVQLYLDIVYKYKIYEPGFPRDATAFAREQVAMLLPRETDYIGYSM